VLKELLKKLTSKKDTPPAPVEKRQGRPRAKRQDNTQQMLQSQLQAMIDKTFQKPPLMRKATSTPGVAMDTVVAMDSFPTYNPNLAFNDIIPAAQLGYFSNQSFIGYQLCALLSQHWLISKCCLVPAEDAIRNGYEITSNDGTEIKPDILDDIKQLDVKFHLNKNLVELVQMGRIFGMRICMFRINFDTEEEEREFYENPFNIDAVKPGSYRGMSQIDPYWMTFQLDDAAAGDPASIRFYEPTWWVINSLKVHYTHLIIFRTEQVPDILKPTYFYGGIPIPQKIFTRVYAAERCANEAPLLLLTKRTSILKLDVTQAIANEPGDNYEPGFVERMNEFVNNHNNFGVKTIGEDEEYDQKDTTLADVDEVTMQQYQLVASAANVPAIKLLGTSPKGFQATGEYEEASYHEELESIQTHDLTQMVERHHQLLIVSEILPKYKIAPFSTNVEWASLDAMTAKEKAELNHRKTESDKTLVEIGAIDAEEVRERIIKDSESGYNGLIQGIPGKEEFEDKNEY
jgi:uncharacterized protein